MGLNDNNIETKTVSLDKNVQIKETSVYVIDSRYCHSEGILEVHKAGLVWKKAIVLIWTPNGTLSALFNNFIDEQTRLWMPVFVIWSNYQYDDWPAGSGYATDVTPKRLWALYLEKVNINCVLEIQNFIEEQVSKWIKWCELGQVVYEYYSYKVWEARPKAEWNITWKVVEEMIQLHELEIKRILNMSD